MAQSTISGARIAGVVSCAPKTSFDNVADASQFPRDDVRKVVVMAGVARRRVAPANQCSSDLCFAAAERLLADLGWERSSIDGLIFVTQTPDYHLPSTACVVHKRLALGDGCAAFDVGLGCSGYPYGLWLAHMMVGSGGMRRVLLLHGETPTKFTDESDRATYLLFGDAGSATALERAPGARASFVLQTDGQGLGDLIIHAGGFRERFGGEMRRHYLEMNGPGLFNFTIKRVPPLIEDTLKLDGRTASEIDCFVLHQSNRFMMLHLAKKLELPPERMPLTLAEFGNTGGPSVPLTLVHALPAAPRARALSVMMIGYGVGLSWGSALADIGPDVPVSHIDI